MTLTLKDLIKNGILNELAALFDNEDMANVLLDLINFSGDMRPQFPNNGRTLDYWMEICNQIQAGVLSEETDLQTLINAAADIYPANPVFQQYRSAPESDGNDSTQQTSVNASETQQASDNNLFNILIQGRDDAANILASAQVVAPAQNISPENITLRFSGNGVVLLGLNNCDSNTVASFSQGLQAILQSGQNQVQVSVLTEDPQPYLISRLFVQGPDRARFAIEDILSDTTVGEVAKGVMAQEYDPRMFQDSRGRGRRVVVDRVNEDGSTERLNQDLTLHEANIQEQDLQPYLISRIFVEGPDRARFAIEDILSDTTVGEVAKGVMAEGYDPRMFQDSRFVVDRVNKEGSTERLNQNQTLHETNVQENDILHVVPEATAGCFPGHTMVTLEDKKEKPIQDIKVGDYLLSYDSKNNQFKSAIVTEIYQGLSKEKYILNHHLEVTASHLVFANGYWIRVEDLKIGDKLKNKFEQEVLLTSLIKNKENSKVYNLHLNSKEHTFFAQGILVHNMEQKAMRGKALRNLNVVSSDVNEGRGFLWDLPEAVNLSFILVQGWQTATNLIEQARSIATEEGMSPANVNLEFASAKGVLLSLTNCTTEQAVPLANRLKTKISHYDQLAHTSVLSSKLQEQVLEHLLIEGSKQADTDFEISNSKALKLSENVEHSEDSTKKLEQAVLGQADLEGANITTSKNGENKDKAKLESSSFKKIERHTKIDFPSECILEQEVELKIQLTLKLPQETKASQLISFTVDDETEEVKLNVHITSPAFKIQQHSKPLLLHFGRDSEEITFVLVPVILGEQIIEIEFFHEASRVGYVLVKTNVKKLESDEVNT